MSRAQSLLFGVAVVFAGWNILNNGLSVRSGAIALLIIICLVINIYNNNQKKTQQLFQRNFLKLAIRSA